MNQRVAVFVDGENIGSAHAAAIAGIAERQGKIVLARVYGDVSRLNGWQDAHRYKIVHARSGKNATDIVLSLDALELALEGRFDICVIGSSDRDFSHLALKLRERAICVVGVGRSASPEFVAKCSSFNELGAAASLTAASALVENLGSEIDLQVREVIAKHGKNGAIKMVDLNPIMRAEYNVRISQRPERTWRNFFLARAPHYVVDPKGPEAKVRTASPQVAS